MSQNEKLRETLQLFQPAYSSGFHSLNATSKRVLAANPKRKFLYVATLSTTRIQLGLGFTPADTTGIPLDIVAGGTDHFQLDGEHCFKGEVFLYSAGSSNAIVTEGE